MSMQPDASDGVFTRQVAATIGGLLWAVHRGDERQIAGEIVVLLNVITAHLATLGERPGDEPLRRAVAALSANG